jgi:hypothetical protein
METEKNKIGRKQENETAEEFRLRIAHTLKINLMEKELWKFEAFCPAGSSYGRILGQAIKYFKLY